MLFADGHSNKADGGPALYCVAVAIAVASINDASVKCSVGGVSRQRPTAIRRFLMTWASSAAWQASPSWPSAMRAAKVLGRTCLAGSCVLLQVGC